MSSSRLLLVEENPVRANHISSALELDNFEPFVAGSFADAKEALGLRQFDLVLVSTALGPPPVAAEFSALAKRLSPPVAVLAYGEGDTGTCDAFIPSSVSPNSLGAEIRRLSALATLNQDRIAAQLTAFDLLAFRQQMGEDADLMSEIIAIFFEESAEQLRNLRETVASKDFQRTSRLAHSLKGSLGSLHAARARHWAQALESAAAAADEPRCQRCLSALEQSIAALEPTLRELLHS